MSHFQKSNDCTDAFGFCFIKPVFTSENPKSADSELMNFKNIEIDFDNLELNPNRSLNCNQPTQIAKLEQKSGDYSQLLNHVEYYLNFLAKSEFPNESEESLLERFIEDLKKSQTQNQCCETLQKQNSLSLLQNENDQKQFTDNQDNQKESQESSCYEPQILSESFEDQSSRQTSGEENFKKFIPNSANQSSCIDQSQKKVSNLLTKEEDNQNSHAQSQLSDDQVQEDTSMDQNLDDNGSEKETQLNLQLQEQEIKQIQKYMRPHFYKHPWSYWSDAEYEFLLQALEATKTIQPAKLYKYINDPQTKRPQGKNFTRSKHSITAKMKVIYFQGLVGEFNNDFCQKIYHKIVKYQDLSKKTKSGYAQITRKVIRKNK